jgi:hypothetical protein
MTPWKNSLTESEIYQVVFYIQGFATPQDYNAKWGPQYSDPYARNLKIIQSSIGTTPVAASIILAAIVLRALLINFQLSIQMSLADLFMVCGNESIAAGRCLFSLEMNATVFNKCLLIQSLLG